MNDHPSILIVDDDDGIRRTLEMILTKKGYRVFTAADGETALALAQERFFNLALLDIRLPDMTGLDLLAQLKALHPDLEALIITGYATLESAIQALVNGAYHYFIKPLNVDELLVTLEKALHKQQLVIKNRALLTALRQELEERKRAEDALRETTQTLQAIVESSPLAILALGADGTVKMWNPAAERIFGWSAAEVLGQQNPAVPTELLDESNELFQRVLRGGSLAELETSRQRKDGTRIDVSISAAPLRNSSGAVNGLMAIIADITERKRAERELRLLSLAIEQSHAAVVLTDLIGSIQYVNPRFTQMTGYELEEVYGKSWFALALDEMTENKREQAMRALETGDEWRGEYLRRKRSGEMHWESSVISPIFGASGKPTNFLVVSEDITARKQAERALQRQLRELTALSAVASACANATDADLLIEQVTQIIGDTLYPENFGVRLLDDTRQLLLIHPSYRGVTEEARKVEIPMGQGITGTVAATGKPWRVPDVTQAAAYIAISPETRSELCVPIQVGARVLGVINVESAQLDAFSPADEELLMTLAGQLATALDKVHLFEQTIRRVNELDAIVQVSAALRQAESRAEMLPILLDEVMAFGKAATASLITRDADSGDFIIELARGVWASQIGRHIPADKGISARVFATGQPYVTNDLPNDPLFHHRDIIGNLRALANVPLIAHEQTIGLVSMGRDAPIAEEDVRLLTAIADIAANALHRVEAHERTLRHVQRLTALRAIDASITASLDLRVVFDVLLEQAYRQLDADAMALWTFDPSTYTLQYVAGRGWRSDAIRRASVRMGEGLAGTVMSERRLVHRANLARDASPLARAPWLVGEQMVAYYGVPLIAKGEVQGVLEVFWRKPHQPDSDWLAFLEMIAGQAAIAIDNAKLFSDLQRSNANLVISYDATIEGWSRALELRDRETEGHAQRVTEMTLDLARAMGLGEPELAHVRRGALLHDIGKVGVPDHILFKPDELTPAEWEAMRRHPTDAYNLLLPIPYLRPALDIPYCHHERWDGTGYPRGLKGEEIPLAARIFAVVDVYDALTSDRPYRAAWSVEDALEYIREQAGKQFDPRVVAVFLQRHGRG